MWQKLMFITCSRLAHQRSHNRVKPFLKLQLIFHASAILYLWRDSFWLQTLALVGRSLSPFLVVFAILAVSCLITMQGRHSQVAATSAACRHRFIFCKIQTRHRPCGPCHPWRPCYVEVFKQVSSNFDKNW